MARKTLYTTRERKREKATEEGQQALRKKEGRKDIEDRKVFGLGPKGRQYS